MKKDKMSCLIWPELNDYTGKSKTIACFTSEEDLDIEKFITKISKFWNDLSTWILNSNKNPTDLSQSLKFWFTIEKKQLSENDMEKLVQKENEKYILKNYIIKEEDLYDFSWKKFQEFAKKELESMRKSSSDYMCALTNAFYGPICDTFRQDETGTVSIIKILPSKQMINAFFNQAIKFINSPVVVNKFNEKTVQTATKILENYLNIPKIVEIK